MPEIRRLWQRFERDCEWGAPRAPSVRLLFQDTRATPILLGFLEDTRAGRMPSKILLAGEPVDDESESEEIVLWPPEEKEAESSGESEEGDGPDPPL